MPIRDEELPMDPMDPVEEPLGEPVEEPVIDEVETEINSAVSEALADVAPDASREEKVGAVIEKLETLKTPTSDEMEGLGGEGLDLEGMEPEEEFEL